MKTFKQFLIENKDGNYVCIDSQDLADIWNQYGVKTPMTGESPPKGDYHCTLIYSENSYSNPETIMKFLQSTYDDLTIKAEVIGVDCFDSVPEDGKRDSEKSCIVLKLKSELLQKIHNELTKMGLSHSYPEYSPHVTLRYNMSVEEAHFYRDKINNNAKGPKFIILNKFKSQAINKNYV